MGTKMCKDGSKSGHTRKKAKYYCKSCGSEAVKEKHLCKPKKI